MLTHFLHADDIANTIDEAKRKAALANDTASNTMNKLDDIKKELDKLNVPSVDPKLNSELDKMDKTGETLKLCHDENVCLYFHIHIYTSKD